MFRTNQHCSRYEETPIQLDTPIITPVERVSQDKSGYQFTVNDRSSYFDWFNDFFEVKFSVKKLDSNDGFTGTGADTAAIVATTAIMINGSTSLINNLNTKQNGKLFMRGTVYFLPPMVNF